MVPGVDGRKMSKSYDNTLELFEDPKVTKKRIMKIKTDSTPIEDPKDPDNCTVFALLSLFADDKETEQWRQNYQTGGMGYGQAKKRLAQLTDERLGPFRQKYHELVSNVDYVEDVLRDGGVKARQIACELMENVRSATGIVTSPKK